MTLLEQIQGRLAAGEDPPVWEAEDLVGWCAELLATSPALFGDIEKRARAALGGRSATAWLSRLTKLVKEQEAALKAQKKADALEAKKAALAAGGVPSFELGDDAEIGGLLYQRLRDESTGVLIADFGKRDRQIWRWSEHTGLYEVMTTEELRVRIYGWSGAIVGDEGRPLQVNESRVKGILAAAHAHTALNGGYATAFFAEAPAGVAFKNAFLSVEGSEVTRRDPSPEHRQRWALAYDYDPHGECPGWLSFLQGAFSHEDETMGEVPAKIAALQEFFGACLMRMGGSVGAALVLLGAGANGKSTILRVIRELFGQDAVSVPPQLWDDDPKTIPFSWARINIVEELPTTDVLSSSSFKAIVDASAITRRPLYQEPITFVPTPGQVFAANELLYSPDTTDGFWRRWIVLHFPNQWDVDGSKPHLPRADPGLKTRLLKELPGIAVWALEGAKRFLSQGRSFTASSASHEAVKEWRHESDRIGQWVEENLVLDPDVKTPAKVLFDDYCKFCNERRYHPVNMMRFGQRLKRDVAYSKVSSVVYRARLRSMYDA